MQKIFETFREWTLYCTYENFPITEYVLSMFDTLQETFSIIDNCSWQFNLYKTVKLFSFRYIRTVINIAITSLTWGFWGKQLATNLFFTFYMPNWMLPICLFGASNILTQILNEIIFEYE